VIDVNTLLDLLAAIGGLGGLALIIGVAYWLGNKFTEVNYRFKRVLRLATTNPLTKEEWDKLRLYLDKSEKNELTLEEADELLELSRKVVREYGEYPEAWKLHIYATIVRTLTIMKHYGMRTGYRA